MFDPITAVYALLGGIGLVGADAYLSSSTIHMETIVAPVYAESGFEAHLVEALFLAKLEDIIDANSLEPSPHLLSSLDKPISSALAEAAGLSHALDAAKSTLGAVHPTIILSVLSDNQNGQETQRIVVAGSTSDNRNISMSIPLNGRPLEEALTEAAFKTMKEIDPYITALHAFEVAETEGRAPTEADSLLIEALDRESRDEVDPSRALLENLMGITQLLLNDHLEARYWFGKAQKSDGTFAVPPLNLAFTEAVDGNCGQAMKLVEPLLQPTYWVLSADEEILFSGYNLLGICASQLGKFDDANAFFEQAAAVRPDGTSVYFYWSNSLTRQGKADQADAMRKLAERNVSRMDNVPEIAMLHFWLPETGSKALQKRKRSLPEVQAQLAD